MNIPTSAEYLTAKNDDLRALREKIIVAMFAELRSASNFADVSSRAQRFFAETDAAGFQFRLLDEDGESMVSYGVDLASGRSITAQAYWDEDEGPSATCAFQEEGSRVVLAQSRGGEVVEVERSP